MAPRTPSPTRRTPTTTARTASSYRVFDGALYSAEATVNVTVTSVNDAPVFPAETAQRSVSPNARPGANVGRPVTATDVEGDVLTYTLTGPGVTSFEIEEHTGQITLREGAVLDVETQDSYPVTVTAEDPSFARATITVSITVTTVVQRPPSGGGGGGGGSGSGNGSGSGGGGGGGGGAPPPDPSEIFFSPNTISFEAVKGGDNPPPQTLKVWNAQEREMAFGTSENAPWLARSPSAGISDGPDDAVTIRLSVDVSSLEPGSYTANVRISGRRIGNSPQRVPVTLTVHSPGYARERISGGERTVIATPDSTLRLIVPENATSADVDIEAKKLDVDSLSTPTGDQERVILAVQLQTLAQGTETPQPTTYSPGVELRLLLPEDDTASCGAGRVRVYRVDDGEWELLDHRCETGEEGRVWAVSTLTSFSAFVLTVDDTAYPTGSICWSVSNILSWTSSRTSGDQAAASPVLVWLEGVLRLWLSLSCR